MHFFIDQTKLTTQAATDSYGPDSSDVTHKFNVTSRFQLIDEAKAFACQDGMMVIQKHAVNSDLVNIIIKPFKDLRVPLSVKYYVYRGIVKSSLLKADDDTKIADENTTTNTELIARIYRNTPSDKGSDTLGYDNNAIAGTDNVEEVFAYKRLSYAKPIMVKWGEWIGNFTNNEKIGFEIILNADEVSINLNYVRAEMYQINVSGLSLFTLKCKREEILSYIDPAACFGMHYDSWIGISTYPGGIKTYTYLKNTAIYSTLLENKFYTSNKVYFDIRNEKGLSYNFYGNYGSANNEIKLANQTGSFDDDPNTANNRAEVITYQTNSWPILIIDTAQSYYTNIVRLKLRVDDNRKPIIYVTEKNRKNNNKKSNYINQNNQEKDILNGEATDWSKVIKFVFPDIIVGSNKKYIASYLRIYYYRQKHNVLDSSLNPTTTFPNEVLVSQKYYDNAFCSVDLTNLGVYNVYHSRVKGPHSFYIREDLNPTNGTGNFGFVAENGAFWDENRILFYSTKMSPLAYSGAVSEGKSSGKKYINTYSKKLTLNNKKYNGSFLKQDTEIICREYLTGSGTIKILGINSYKEGGVLNDKENAMLLGLTKDQIAAVKITGGLSDKHPRFIFLVPDSSNPLVESTSAADPRLRYYKYHIKLQGLDSSGNRSFVTPQFNSSNIYVYSRDNQFFHSLEFSANESVGTNNSKKIEYHIYNDGVIKINDNIDLSLVRKKIITGLSESTAEQGLGIYTFENDNSITNDSSGVQTISYYLVNHHSSITSLSGISPIPLNIIREYQKVQYSQLTTEESAASTAQDFADAGYATHSFDFTSFNDNDIDAKNSYKNDTTKDILTRGKLKVQNTNPAQYYTGNKKYKNLNKIIFMVFVDRDLVNASTAINNRFSWYETVRYFARPDLFAVFLGALRDINDTVQCGGFAFPDASSFPSNLHVNGDAFDTNYFQDIGGDNADDLAFIRAIHKYGKGLFRIGPIKQTLRTSLSNITPASERPNWVEGYSLHNYHLHTEEVKIS
ncbi:MAG: hypothetical protein Q8M15_16790 [Bacteroidota bacterium]|nr:hypothetical protein [Bacteroidota bacterium]